MNGMQSTPITGVARWSTATYIIHRVMSLVDEEHFGQDAANEVSCCRIVR